MPLLSFSSLLASKQECLAPQPCGSNNVREIFVRCFSCLILPLNFEPWQIKFGGLATAQGPWILAMTWTVAMLPLGPLGQQDLAKTWELCSRRRWYQLDKEEKGEHTHFFDYRWLSIPTSDTVIPTMHFFSMFLKLLWSTVYDMVRIDSDRHTTSYNEII